MMLNRIITNGGPAGLKLPQRSERDRRFEALYMQSFIEMRARNPKRHGSLTR